MANTGDGLLRVQTDFDDVMGTTVWLMGAGVALRSVVKVDTAVDDTVILADADGDPAEPAIGVVVAINSPIAGSCIVRTVGLVSGFPGASFVRGKRYILSTVAGDLVRSDDIGAGGYPTAGDFKQTIGVARTDTTLMAFVTSTTFENP